MYRIYDIEIDINNTSRVMDDFSPKQGDSGANKIRLKFPADFDSYNIEVKFKMEDSSEQLITGVIAEGLFEDFIPDPVFTNSGTVLMQVKIHKDSYSITDNTGFRFVVSAVL